MHKLNYRAAILIQHHNFISIKIIKRLFTVATNFSITKLIIVYLKIYLKTIVRIEMCQNYKNIN